MTWTDRECPSCGMSPVRWDPYRDVNGEFLADVWGMESPTPFRCDGCGAEWISDTGGESRGEV